MTSAALLLILQTAPQLVGLALKLETDIRAGKGNTVISDADLAEMNRLANQTAEDIYKRLGITPPPAAGATGPTGVA